MKFKTMCDTHYGEVTDLLSHLLLSRGVENVDSLINVSEEDVLNPFQLGRMREAVDCFLKHYKKESKILAIPDEDFDGYSSFALLFNYIKRAFGIELDYVIHPKKVHGIKPKELKEKEFDLLIVPDAGSSDIVEIKELLAINPELDIIILDHHNVNLNKGYLEGIFTLEQYHKDFPAIVVNPQLCDYPNKTLAGVGVCYKFCKALDSQMDTDYADDYLDLVACGQIADVTDLRNHETRYLTLQGIKLLENDKVKAEEGQPTIGNGFLREVVEAKKERDLKHINFMSIGWKIAPIINAVTRVGTIEEKEEMLKAFTECEEVRMYQPRKKKKDDPKPDPIQLSLQEDFVRIATNIKGRQDRAVKKAIEGSPATKKKEAIEGLKDRIRERELDKNTKVLIVNGTGIVEEKGLTGLIAGKLANDYKLPVILLKQYDDEVFGGSTRNFRMSPIENLAQVINQTGLALAKGHDNASGFEGKGKNLVAMRDAINEHLKDVEMEDTHLVDFAIPVGRLKKEDVLKVGKMKNIWGNTIPEPKFAVTDVTIDVADIELIGERKNILKFRKGDHTFIKFFASEEYRDKMIMKKRDGFGKAPKAIVLDLIVTFEQNEYEGKFYPQIVIHDFNTRKKEEILF